MAATLTTANGGAHNATTYSGNGAALTGIVRANISGGTPGQIVVNDGAGLFASIATVDTARGGTGANSAAATGVAKVAAGTWSWSAVTNADISGSAAIARGKIASGTANHVLINDVSGAMSSEALLATSRGGTGINSSLANGVAKISTGIWSASAVVDADIGAGAAIARSKIANGTANAVVINSAGGALSSEAQLSVSRGGTGQDFSGTGPTPSVLQITSGMFTTVPASVAATGSTYVTRDVGGGSAFGTVSATGITSTGALTVTPVGNLTLDPGGVISTADSVLVGVPAGVAGGRISQYVVNLAVTGAPFVQFWTVATAVDTAYTVYVQMTGMDSLGAASASWSLQYRAQNLASTVSKASDMAVVQNADALLANAVVRGAVTTTNLVVEASAIAGRTIKWAGRIVVVEQAK
jgi:hypothetical protein